MLQIWNCEMKKYNFVNKFGREFNNAFTLLGYTIQIFKFLLEIYIKTPLIVTPLSKYVMGRIWFLNFQLSNSHYCLISISLLWSEVFVYSDFLLITFVHLAKPKVGKNYFNFRHFQSRKAIDLWKIQILIMCKCVSRTALA